MRILVCGDRDWVDYIAICKVMDEYLEKHGPDLIVIQGDARGADMLTKMWAEDREVDHFSFPARWKTTVPRVSAGPRRNRRMFKIGQPDLVVSFHDNLAESKGTKDMLKIAKKAGVKVRKVRHKKKAT